MHAVARDHVDIPLKTEHFRAYTDLGNQGVTNVGYVNDTDIHVDRKDTIIPHAGAVVRMINMGFAQAHPNYVFAL